MENLNALFKLAVESGASDVIIKSDKPGYLRIDGRLISVEMAPISFQEARAFIEQSMPKIFRSRWEEEGQVDFSYQDSGGSRFRVNGFHQRGLVSAVMRHIKTLVPTFTQLNLQSDPLIRFAKSKDGIVFICGATGSGKSTTMAAMIDWINQNLDKHIVTIEDPIEYLFSDQKSLIEQREIGLDVPNFDLSLKSVLRQDPASFYSERCATGKALKQQSAPPKRATSCYQRCTPRRSPKRSPDSLNFSHRINSNRRADRSPDA